MKFIDRLPFINRPPIRRQGSCFPARTLLGKQIQSADVADCPTRRSIVEIQHRRQQLMVDPEIATDLLGASLPFPAKPPKTLGEFFGRLLIVVVLLGALYLLGMAMLQSFIDGFLP